LYEKSFICKPTNNEVVAMSKTLALALILVFLTLMTLVVVLFQPVSAQVERVTTYCTIFVDNLVEGQPVTATIQMSPSTPTGEGYTQLIVYLKSPNGVGASSPNGPWVYTNISTDPNGKVTVTFDVPTYIGKWYVFVDFGSHSYANYSKLYLAGTWQAGFTVSPIKTPTPYSTATPTASPIPTDNLTPTPTVPEFPSWTILLNLSVVVAIAGFLIYFKKHKS
jgi:hypothetical protein